MDSIASTAMYDGKQHGRYFPYDKDTIRFQLF
jgi:hypothetical protein